MPHSMEPCWDGAGRAADCGKPMGSREGCVVGGTHEEWGLRVNVDGYGLITGLSSWAFFSLAMSFSNRCV